jgi:hypothetical protein
VDGAQQTSYAWENTYDWVRVTKSDDLSSQDTKDDDEDMDTRPQQCIRVTTTVHGKDSAGENTGRRRPISAPIRSGAMYRASPRVSLSSPDSTDCEEDLLVHEDESDEENMGACTAGTGITPEMIMTGVLTRVRQFTVMMPPRGDEVAARKQQHCGIVIEKEIDRNDDSSSKNNDGIRSKNSIDRTGSHNNNNNNNNSGIRRSRDSIDRTISNNSSRSPRGLIRPTDTRSQDKLITSAVARVSPHNHARSIRPSSATLVRSASTCREQPARPSSASLIRRVPVNSEQPARPSSASLIRRVPTDSEPPTHPSSTSLERRVPTDSEPHIRPSSASLTRRVSVDREQQPARPSSANFIRRACLSRDDNAGHISRPRPGSAHTGAYARLDVNPDVLVCDKQSTLMTRPHSAPGRRAEGGDGSSSTYPIKVHIPAKTAGIRGNGTRPESESGLRKNSIVSESEYVYSDDVGAEETCLHVASSAFRNRTSTNLSSEPERSHVDAEEGFTQEHACSQHGAETEQAHFMRNDVCPAQSRRNTIHGTTLVSMSGSKDAQKSESAPAEEQRHHTTQGQKLYDKTQVARQLCSDISSPCEETHETNTDQHAHNNLALTPHIPTNDIISITQPQRRRKYSRHDFLQEVVSQAQEWNRPERRRARLVCLMDLETTQARSRLTSMGLPLWKMRDVLHTLTTAAPATGMCCTL